MIGSPRGDDANKDNDDPNSHAKFCNPKNGPCGGALRSQGPLSKTRALPERPKTHATVKNSGCWVGWFSSTAAGRAMLPIPACFKCNFNLLHEECAAVSLGPVANGELIVIFSFEDQLCSLVPSVAAAARRPVGRPARDRPRYLTLYQFCLVADGCRGR